MQIGIDFGSTYSTVSRFDPVTGNVKVINRGAGSPVEIPSVVSIERDTGDVACGTLAKENIGDEDYRIFEAFKMLLVAADGEMLRARGYDDEHTPRSIAKLYLESILSTALRNENETKIENLIICAPNIWSARQNTKDGRRILREVLKDTDLPIGDVQVVEEPEAASAFFAYYLEQATKSAFNGHLLLIDFGGGTLDLTLTQVNSDGRGQMEICYREDGGAGENHPGRDGKGVIGSAGFAYMQAVVLQAIREAGILEPEGSVDYTDPEFLSAVRKLERNMIENFEKVEDYYGQFGTYYSQMAAVLEEDAEEFAMLKYRRKKVPVTYQQMYVAYRDTISEVLEREIRSINGKTRSHIHGDPCDPASGARESFKIALVGGFNSFCLVRAQLAEIYNLDFNQNSDPRVSNIPQDLQIRAISLGAALIAAGKVQRQRVAHYSIGLCTKNSAGEINGLYYGIKYHQVIVPGKPYFILRRGKTKDVPENRVVWGALKGNIKQFAIEFTERQDYCQPFRLRPEILAQLEELPEYGVYYCGFSFGEDDVVTFHVIPVPIPGADNGAMGKEIRLDSYRGMFDLSPIEEVHVNAV